jgi:hypothetical protein
MTDQTIVTFMEAAIKTSNPAICSGNIVKSFQIHNYDVSSNMMRNIMNGEDAYTLKKVFVVYFKKVFYRHPLGNNSQISKGDSQIYI